MYKILQTNNNSNSPDFVRDNIISSANDWSNASPDSEALSNWVKYILEIRIECNWSG